MTAAPACCNPQEGPEIVTLRGPVSAQVLVEDSAARRAEESGLAEEILAYHYFDGDLVPAGSISPLVDMIWNSRSIQSRIRCMTENEILASVRNATVDNPPHYGDGAYCTLRDQFQEAHRTVVVAHGINPAITRYRAVIRLRKPGAFRKFDGTGGVIRSIPHGMLTRDERAVIGEDTGEIHLLRIERFSDGKWQRVSYRTGGGQ